MTKRWLPALSLALLSILTGCEKAPTTPDSGLAPQFAPGGVSGPPSTVVIPRPPGPPPQVPVPLPPQAGPPSFLQDIVEIGAGNDFSCALRTDGLVFCWGANGAGQLGDGSLAPSSVPVEVSGPARFAHLVVGSANACGLTATGEAWCWGSNTSGLVGAGPGHGTNVRTPVAVSGGLSFTDLAIGLATMCGVATDDITYCWGSNSLALFGNGTQGGSSDVPVPVMYSGTLGFVSISVGFFHACALNAAGSAYCWGISNFGLFGNGSAGLGVPVPTAAAGGATLSAIETGITYTCGLDNAGVATCWGTSNFSGEIGIGSTANPILSPTPVAGSLTFASLDAGNNNSFLMTTCGTTTTNEAWCWGSNQFGQLGASSTEVCSFSAMNYACSTSPVRVSGGNAFRQIAAGLRHVCAVDVNGVAWCWGSNSMGQLGDGSMVDSQSPLRVRGLQAPAMIGSIVLSPVQSAIRLLGATQAFTATALDEYGVPLAAQPAFTWSSSNPGVATIDAAGVATAVADGGTIVTATAPNGSSGRAPLSVLIIDPVLAFQQAWAGDPGDGMVALGGLLADEWLHSGTFPTRREVDQRAITATNGTVALAYAQLDTARIALEFEAARLQSVDPLNPKIGELLALAGYTYIGFAENFCSGVPLFDPNVGLSTTDLFNLAATRFGEALSSPIAGPFDHVAHVGTGRAQLGLGNFAAAGAAAAQVPFGFLYTTASTPTVGERNFIYIVTALTPRFSVSDAEGTNGLPFRSANDTRVPWVANGLGFNAVTPHYLQTKYTSVDSDIIVASSIEARLIQLEAVLAIPDTMTFRQELNALRAVGGLAAVAVPTTQAGRVDLLFSERAFWMYATGQRLGDVRRLIAHYGRSESSVLPVGPYQLGGNYGTDANLPVPMGARGPTFNGCVDRSH